MNFAGEPVGVVAGPLPLLILCHLVLPQLPVHQGLQHLRLAACISCIRRVACCDMGWGLTALAGMRVHQSWQHLYLAACN